MRRNNWLMTRLETAMFLAGVTLMAGGAVWATAIRNRRCFFLERFAKQPGSTTPSIAYRKPTAAETCRASVLRFSRWQLKQEHPNHQGMQFAEHPNIPSAAC